VNSRLDELQAAVLRVKLRYLDAWNSRRRDIAAHYLNSLKESGLELPFVPNWAEPVWHLFVVRSPEREAWRRSLLEQGVSTLIHYPVPPHLQATYRDMHWPRGSFPITEDLHKRVFSLPLGPHLTDEQLEAVVSSLRVYAA
jgi:dTDP-4-amino-4,6-dideoxygalactose transaminase